MAAMECLQKHLQRIRIPITGEKIYKDECVFSFDTPESESGLYVCLSTFYGFGKKHVERHFHRTGNAVFLNLKKIRKLIPKESMPSEKQSGPTRLAIGVEGGFSADQKDKYEFEEHNSIVILPNFYTIPLPDQTLPDVVQASVAAVLVADGAFKLSSLEALSGTWEGEKLKPSKHEDNLLQLDNGIKIPPSGWRCEACDMSENLWLNLTDGSVLCGRKNFDGSGGNDHAFKHYEQTKYPLAVKLGTINPSGADVYSYDEQNMVLDRNLAKHLAHFGINIAFMEKTEKTMMELDIQLNLTNECKAIQESDRPLVPLYGPGYTGLENLGNSCYLNSVIQVVMNIPEFQKKYYRESDLIFENAPEDPTQDFTVQMSKLAVGIWSGEYSKEPAQEGSNESIVKEHRQGIKPQMFKNLIGKGHPEFSTKKQQDAQEFFLHFLNTVERNCRNQTNPVNCFKFEVEERIKCMASDKVQYLKRTDSLLSLPIPLSAAVNKEEVQAFEAKRKELESKGERIDPSSVVRSKIPLSACLEAFTSPEIIDDFYSPAVNAKGHAEKTIKLQTFPDYLMIQLKKYAVGKDWVPMKLDVSVDVPYELDLKNLRGKGQQPGEELLPEVKSSGEFGIQVNIDQAVLAQLCEMGFSLEACKKAVYNTGNTGVEAASAWIMEHMGDPDFDSPFIIPGVKPSQDAFIPDEGHLATIMSMGFSKDQAVKALKATENNVERAIDWMFSHTEEVEPMDIEGAAAPGPTVKDGHEKYQLVAFISHMGTSTTVGHYVCHILKDGRWVIFNDEKVAISENPPKDLGYMYLYKRT